MRPPHRTGLLVATLATVMPLVLPVATLFAPTAQAEGKGVPSDATAIPMPPPAPPPRPAELGASGPARPETVIAEPVMPEPVMPAPARIPRPPERPAELGAAPAAPGGPVKPEAGETPMPPPRPPELAGQANPSQSTSSQVPPGQALAITVTPPDDGACRRRLERLGARFEPLPALANGQCGAARPLKVTALADALALTPPVTLVCDAAEALARWATEAQAAAERELGQPLTGLTIGTSYECRGQNHDPDAKLSEHSFANGVDVMGFTFAKRPAIGVTPLPDGTPEATFLADVRGRACRFFRTVLGPGSDAAHANHLHLDERERNAGHRLCQ